MKSFNSHVLDENTYSCIWLLLVITNDVSLYGACDIKLDYYYLSIRQLQCNHHFQCTLKRNTDMKPYIVTNIFSWVTFHFFSEGI